MDSTLPCLVGFSILLRLFIWILDETHDLHQQQNEYSISVFTRALHFDTMSKLGFRTFKHGYGHLTLHSRLNGKTS